MALLSAVVALLSFFWVFYRPTNISKDKVSLCTVMLVATCSKGDLCTFALNVLLRSSYASRPPPMKRAQRIDLYSTETLSLVEGGALYTRLQIKRAK